MVLGLILICRIDVKNAFRQVLVDPGGAPALGYTMGDIVAVGWRCQFGWRSSSSVLEHEHTRTTTLPDGAAVVQHVKLVPPQDGSSAVPLPHDCQQTIGSPAPRFHQILRGPRGVDCRAFLFARTPVLTCGTANRF